MMRATRILMMALIGVLALMAGCSNDLYESCSFDGASSDPRERECAVTGAMTNCVVDTHPDCSGACVLVEGDGPYCSEICTSDDDCGDGSCQLLPTNSDKTFCVRN